MTTTSSHNGVDLLGEAKLLRQTLKDLRKRMEEYLLEHNENTSTVEKQIDETNEEQTPGTDEQPSKEIGREGTSSSESARSDDGGEHSQPELIESEPSLAQTLFPTTLSEKHGFARLRAACVAIVGNISQRGLKIADTLVKCGIKKLILFDDEDSSSIVEAEKSKWDLEENPSFELEAYVSAYDLNADSYEHFLDRLMHGTEDDRPVDLVIMPNSQVNSSLYELTSKATLTVGCPLLSGVAGEATIMVLEPGGNQIEVTDDSTTLSMAALEFLLV